MAKKKDYIPGSIPKFIEFQANLVAHIVLNAVAWGIAALKVTDFQALQTAYLLLYNVIANPATKTTGAIHAHETGMKLFKKQIRAFVKTNIAGNTAVTPQQRIDMKLNPGDNPRNPRLPITTAPNVSLYALGGLEIRIECRVVGDETRASIHPDADGMEMRSAVSAFPPIHNAPADTPHLPPANYSEATDVSFSSKARITEIVDDPSVKGKYIYVFVRWVNLTAEAKSGPWSAVAHVMIS